MSRHGTQASTRRSTTSVVIVEDGRVLEDALSNYQISEGEILQQARLSQGIERLEQIKYAVLERNGGISIVPKSG